MYQRCTESQSTLCSSSSVLSTCTLLNHIHTCTHTDTLTKQQITDSSINTGHTRIFYFTNRENDSPWTAKMDTPSLTGREQKKL